MVRGDCSELGAIRRETKSKQLCLMFNKLKQICIQFRFKFDTPREFVVLSGTAPILDYSSFVD